MKYIMINVYINCNKIFLYFLVYLYIFMSFIFNVIQNKDLYNYNELCNIDLNLFTMIKIKCTTFILLATKFKK